MVVVVVVVLIVVVVVLIVGLLAMVVDFKEVVMTSPPEMAHCLCFPPCPSSIPLRCLKNVHICPPLPPSFWTPPSPQQPAATVTFN